MDIGSTVSLYDQINLDIDQYQKTYAPHIDKLGKAISSFSNLVSANKAALEDNNEATNPVGLFGKEDGFMSKFGTGKGWFSETFGPDILQEQNKEFEETL